MSNFLLKIDQLTKTFKYFEFGPIDVRVEPGTITALIGSNGSGKSTFFRLVMQLFQPNSGHILYFNAELDSNDSRIKQDMGYAGGDLYQAFGQLSIRELANLVRYWYENWDEQKYQELVDRYQINQKEKYTNSSTGTKKKIAFIFALAHHPQLLLLDEPFSGVDFVSSRKMQTDLVDFMENPNHAIILATHQQEEIKALCDYIWLLDKGKMIGIYEKDQILESWAYLSLNKMPESLRKHPHVIQMDSHPNRIITDSLAAIEPDLEQLGIEVTHYQRLELDEILTALLERA
ncbi:ATP-binding cassette domain-containing protein [Gracilibacillus dipsosauri]|uniref:ATP-binding cassette domain-containing protein n=1 Tax=Gracilibacillus dipsosauri TaxID=178340 RepID=UPI00240A6F02